ncbi:hypothetical protein L596_000576 [Steinernema carpocapsae]|uniref:Uncharacterized protein n=1 Tax=Steinernema carpocapsae TaxID=34508 RepID=A0A4U8UKX6_STECR|nr:hypothetical protein L596_000576 [Steinernema carpocapsae]
MAKNCFFYNLISGYKPVKTYKETSKNQKSRLKKYIKKYQFEKDNLGRVEKDFRTFDPVTSLNPFPV